MRKRLMYSLILALSDDEHYFKHVTSSEEDVLFVTLHRVFVQVFLDILMIKPITFKDLRFLALYEIQFLSIQRKDAYIT